MKRPDAALTEISAFIANFRLGDEAKVNLDNKSKSVYRLFQSLLLWQLAFDKEEKLKEQGYFDEFLSDAASSYFLALTSAYKPSAVLLRSAIENLVRSLLAFEGVDVSKIGTVWELFSKAKESFKASKDTVRRIASLHAKYGELCKTTHSVSYDYMSLRIPFDKIFQHDTKKLAEASRGLKEVFNLANEVLYLVNAGALNAIHHRASDAIRDVISPTLKAKVSKAK